MCRISYDHQHNLSEANGGSGGEVTVRVEAASSLTTEVSALTRNGQHGILKVMYGIKGISDLAQAPFWSESPENQRGKEGERVCADQSGDL